MQGTMLHIPLNPKNASERLKNGKSHGFHLSHTHYKGACIARFWGNGKGLSGRYRWLKY